MGMNDRDNERKLNKRERAKAGRSRRASSGGNTSWEQFQWPCFIALAEELVKVGGAVRLGATRDGGAWALGIYVGDDYATEYVRPAEDFETALAEIVVAWCGDAAGSVWWERVLALRAAAAR